MKIKIFGARGSIPTPLTLKEYHEKISRLLLLFKESETKEIDLFLRQVPFHLSHIYGGNTACVSVKDENEELLVLDAGSGIRALGNELADLNEVTIHILFSHFHWDHICGLPFFKPIYNPTNTIVFYSPDENIVRNLFRQQHSCHFPLPFNKLPAKKKFVILEECREIDIGNYKILNIPLNHPGGSSGYIIQKNNKKVSYVTDTEFTPEMLEEKAHFYKACFESSNILILDCQYSLTEFFSKFNWGHTSSTMAVNLALDWRVKKLILFHYDPSHSDEELEKILAEANKFKHEFNRRKIDIIQAVEGQEIEI